MNNIQLLNNPKSIQYRQFKDFILNSGLQWGFHESTVTKDKIIPEGKKDLSYFDQGTDSYFFSHPFLLRGNRLVPYSMLPDVNDKVYEKENLIRFLSVCREILEFNGKNLGSAYRASANLLLGDGKESWSPIHVDHFFPHYNLLIYLTQSTSGGTLRVYNEKYSSKNLNPNFTDYEEYCPNEDDVVLFNGLHYHSSMPSLVSGEKRVCLILTFIEVDI